MPDHSKDRVRRRKEEAAERGLTFKQWMAQRKELGLDQLPQQREKQPKQKKQAELYRSDLRLSDAAVELVEHEKLAARRHQPIIATVPCPKLRFVDLVSADMALQRMQIDTPDVWDEYLHAYECRRCGGVHLGHKYE